MVVKNINDPVNNEYNLLIDNLNVIDVFSDLKNKVSTSINYIFESNYYHLSKYEGINYLELDNNFFENISDCDYKNLIIKILVFCNNNGNPIDYIKLPDDLSREQKRGIFNIIYENFPIVGINRLEKGNELLNINFFGIKDLNEKVGKDLVDKFINGLKNLIISNFDNYNPNGRLVINSYKNVTFSYDKTDDILKELFGNISDQINLIDYIFNEYFNSTDFINTDFNELKQNFYNLFSIGFGHSEVKHQSKFYKLYSYYKSYIGSKKKNKSNKFNLNKFKLSDLTFESNKILEVKKLIVKYYENKTIFINGNDIDIVKLVKGKYSINEKLLSYYRKGGIIEDTNLQKLLKIFMNTINENFDFLSPLNYFDDIYTKKDELLLNEGKINSLFFIKNNKGFYNKDYFNEFVTGKEGFNCFIDIVDMGISNVDDCINIVDLITNDITNKQYILKNILHGGITGTTKLSALAKNINSQFRGVSISLLGDEIFLHFENNNINNNILNKLNKIFTQIGLKTRLSYGINSEVGYNILDEFTKINKFIKTLIEKNYIDINVNNLEIYIDPKFNNLILQDIDFFIKQLGQNIILNNFIDVLKSKNSKSIISTFDILQDKADESIKYDKNFYINCVVSLTNTNLGFKIIIGS